MFNFFLKRINKFIELVDSCSMAITISQKTKVSMTAILVHYVVNTKNEASIEETVDGDRYLFDSQHCITIFKKLANLYGQEFKSISVGEQYVYDSNLKRYVLGEHELDTIQERG